ncbi:precorrin-2 C(20)-methyltransferase [Candidatus Contubernalis alkaliaceticus]|uniref:precorrin-2 C(20)-methyltransferase n=1 Tax=Candidatus Contubernalis alkaliaceticus TaxID=338645 RepID=UPI001F4BFC82|nr:precorrin-2 C(20)-methyltransferase [Candidatus Contubernalis alkalaceticus]UNC92498.1 precorrin-2 C(20)-methyltransferase [Candidatus Contubernalis alkalaceticus]
MNGKLCAVGVGPGEPELLTLKAVKALNEAQVIAVPKGYAEKESVALLIISPFIQGKKILELVFPMTDDKEVLTNSWQEAAEKISSLLKKGENVVFATLGDPSLYSTFNYLKATLEQYDTEDFIVEIIPGINSFSAAASLLQEPLVEGSENMAVVSTPQNTSRLKEIIELFDTVVLLKVHRYFEQVLDCLKELGLENNGYYVSRCGSSKEFFSQDLETLAGEKLDYLSMLIIKK